MLLEIDWRSPITILLLLVCPKHVQGASVTLHGSSADVMLLETFTFTCTVTKAADITDRIEFYKGTEPEVFATLFQNGSACSVSHAAKRSGYSAWCGNGTDVSSAATKEYHLEINKTVFSDSTMWWCRLGQSEVQSNNFSLFAYLPSARHLAKHPNSVTMAIAVVVLVAAVSAAWLYNKRMKRPSKGWVVKTDSDSLQNKDGKYEIDNPTFTQTEF